MKNILFLLALLFCIGRCSAQNTLPEFAPHGAHWTYAADELSHLAVLFSDSIVNGKTCKQFTIDGSLYFFAYRDSLKIMGHELDTTKAWQVLYDFGWPPGTPVNVPVGGYMPLATFYTVSEIVQSVTSTVINSDTLPVLNFQDPYYPSVIMNIGCTSNFFFPVLTVIPEEGVPYLRCYTDAIIGAYKMPGVLACDTTAGIQPKIVSNNINIYPNPATDVLHIQTANNTTVLQVSITSLDGRTLQALPLNNQNIPLNDLTNGMYLVSLHMQDGNTVTKKLIVQR